MALINSAILAAGALAIALPVGLCLAVGLAKFRFPGRRGAAAALGVLLFLPLYIHLTAWDAALGKLGWHALLFGSLAEPLLEGMRGAVFVHGMAAIPWVAAIVWLGLLQVDPAQEESALMVVPPWHVIWRVTLPQARAFVAAAAIWVVVGTAADMTVTNIYLIDPSQQTYTERFYMALALSADATRAASGVWPGVAALSALIIATVWMVGRLGGNRLGWRHLRSSQALGHSGVAVTVAMWGVVLVLLGIPLASLVIKAGFVVIQDAGQRAASWSALACLREVMLAPRRFSRELWDSARVAAGAATVALVAGGSLAWQARRGGWRASAATIAIVLGLAVPGPLVGAALVQLFNHDVPPRLPLGDASSKSWLLLLYDDTALAPVIAQGIRALPLVTLLLWHSFATVSRNVLEAAALDGLSPAKVFMRVVLAQRWRAIAAAWLVGFAIAAGDLAWAHLVTPPGLDLLQRRVFGLVHSGVEEQVAAIGLLVMLTYGSLAAGVLWLLRARASTLGPEHSSVLH